MRPYEGAALFKGGKSAGAAINPLRWAKCPLGAEKGGIFLSAVQNDKIRKKLLCNSVRGYLRLPLDFAAANY